MIDAHLSGQNSWAYYLTNILLHCITCSLLYYLLFYTGKEKRRALLVTLIFAVHPLFVQTVAWAPSRGDMMIAAFGLVSFISFIHYCRTTRILFLILHLAAYGLAVLSKESAILIPVVCFGYYFFIEKERKLKISGLVIPALFYIVIVSLFLYIRNDIVMIRVAKSQFGLMSLVQNLRTIPELLSRFFLPLGLGPMPAFSVFFTVAGSVLFVLLVAHSFIYWQSSGRLYLFGLSWFLIFLGPALMYVNTFGTAACDYMEHRGYFPLVGIAVFVYLILIKTEWIRKIRNLNIYLICILVIFSVYTYVYSLNYKDPLTYYTLATETNPKSAVAYFCRGTVYMTNGNKLPDAIRDFDQAIKIKPDYMHAYLNKGYSLEQLKDNDGAFYNYRYAAHLQPTASEPWVDIASLKSTLGETAGAILAYDTALRLNPLFSEGYNARGLLRQEVKDYPGALDDFDEAVGLNPKYAEAYLDRGALKYEMNDFEASMSDLNAAIRFNNKYPEAWLNRGVLKLRTGDSQGACSDWRTASQFGSDQAKALLEEYCK
jgi:tetratricopeptide (TPR) repeat protein